jgi:hypothetical protein
VKVWQALTGTTNHDLFYTNAKVVAAFKNYISASKLSLEEIVGSQNYQVFVGRYQNDVSIDLAPAAFVAELFSAHNHGLGTRCVHHRAHNLRKTLRGRIPANEPRCTNGGSSTGTCTAATITGESRRVRYMAGYSTRRTSLGQEYLCIHQEVGGPILVRGVY